MSQHSQFVCFQIGFKSDLDKMIHDFPEADLRYSVYHGSVGYTQRWFSQIFVLYNPMVIRVADIIDTYVCEGGNDWLN